MIRTSIRVAICLALVGVFLAFAPPSFGQQGTRDTPEELLDAWVDLWGSYDLDLVPVLFLRDDALTYFSSETEGLLEGFDRIVEHHRGFGFVPGGAPQDRLIWVRDVQIREFDDVALIGAIWYFGDPDSPADAQRGPMSLLAVQMPDGYRIAHMNFSTYADAGADAGDSAQAVQPELLQSHFFGGPMWVGSVEPDHLTRAPFDEWYESGYEGYVANAGTVAALSTALDAVEVEVYFGTWCDDSQQEVPRLIRVLDDAGFAPDRLAMIAFSDHPGEFKLSPGGKERQRLIHRTPTIVLSRDGREIGRIVQYPLDSIEEDLLAIARGEAYVPRFTAEARLHEMVSAGGVGALEGRTSRIADELGALGDADSLWHYAQYDLLFNGKPAEAERALDVFLQLYPESAHGYLLRARAHRDLGDREKALIDVRRSLEYDPGNEEARSLEKELSGMLTS